MRVATVALDGARGRADAALIAAAPDLYDILNGILTLNGSRIDPDLAKAANAALVKARGAK